MVELQALGLGPEAGHAVHRRPQRTWRAATERDEGLLESALDRPKNRWSYEQAELAELAAAYAFGIARNHPFVDGNKRTSLLALYTFLGVNGVDFAVHEAEAAAIILALAAGEVSEESLTRWIKDNRPADTCK